MADDFLPADTVLLVNSSMPSSGGTTLHFVNKLIHKLYLGIEKQTLTKRGLLEGLPLVTEEGSRQNFRKEIRSIPPIVVHRENK